MKHMADRSLGDVGGTRGGLGSFVLGLVLSCVGGYLLTNQVMVTSGYWNLFGTSTFGITLLPMLIGVAMLFFNGRSPLGWLLTVAGGLFILAGVIANLHIYFAPTSLFNTLVMLMMLVGGLALIAKALRAS
jgi:predicted membrane channel-forming protein YqfA (hemolysin III family)